MPNLFPPQKHPSRFSEYQRLSVWGRTINCSEDSGQFPVNSSTQAAPCVPLCIVLSVYKNKNKKPKKQTMYLVINLDYNFVHKIFWVIFKWYSIFFIENEFIPFQIISRFFISSIKWWPEQFKPRNNVKLVSKTIKKCLYMIHCFSLWCLFRFGNTTKSHAKTHSARTWVKD